MVVSKRIMEGRGDPGEGLPNGWIRKKEPALKLSYYYNEVRRLRARQYSLTQH